MAVTCPVAMEPSRWNNYILGAGVRSTSTELSDPIWFFTLESHFKVLGPIKPLHLRAPLADEPRPDHEQDRALSDAYAT